MSPNDDGHPFPVSNQLQFYLERAQQARADAQAATLENVRDRCLRSAVAWDEMAARLERTERMRCKNESAKAPVTSE